MSLNQKIEIVAPAGSPQAGYAAFAFGADAVYAGLRQFSARSDAQNFSRRELDELTAYAHSFPKPRKVFAAVNTLVKEHEIPRLIHTLDALSRMNVDAVIVQDLGTLKIARKYFPELPIHASTQLAAHSAYGVATLTELGCKRVVIARESTFETLTDAANVKNAEVEAFVHGALCYSQSGMCLFSSHLLGKSGNRGCCSQPCRVAMRALSDDFESLPTETEADTFPFSLRDFSLSRKIKELKAAGITAIKIEGRKRSPLYVAAAVNLYRNLLDRDLDINELSDMESDLRTVFSREWTEYIAGGEAAPIDPHVTGNRGAFLGMVESVTMRTTEPRSFVRLKLSRPLELHDGIQIDVPELDRPFGFANTRMRIDSPTRRNEGGFTVRAERGDVVEIELPFEYPLIPPQSRVACVSSQEVKRSFKFTPPKKGLHRTRIDIDIVLQISEMALSATASTKGSITATAEAVIEGNFTQARDITKVTDGAKNAFSKLGDTRFSLADIKIENPSELFAPLSLMNELRRNLADILEAAYVRASNDALSTLVCKVLGDKKEIAPKTEDALWSINIDQPNYLNEFTPEEIGDLSEVIYTVGAKTTLKDIAQIKAFAEQGVNQPKLRIALPPLEPKDTKFSSFINDAILSGVTNFQISNVYGLALLKELSADIELNITADWPLYVLNHYAADLLTNMGIRRVTISPEDDLSNIATLLPTLGGMAEVILYSDTPLMMSNVCIHTTLNGQCDGLQESCSQPRELLSAFGDKLVVYMRDCISHILHTESYSISSSKEQLQDMGAAMFRAEFKIRSYSPKIVRDIFMAVKRGENLPHTRTGNHNRILQ